MLDMSETSPGVTDCPSTGSAVVGGLSTGVGLLAVRTEGVEYSSSSLLFSSLTCDQERISMWADQ